VLRREATRSDRASPGGVHSLSQSCDACPLDRARLHRRLRPPSHIGVGDSLRGLWLRRRPQKPNELASDRDHDHDLRSWFAFLEQARETAMETLHSLVGYRDDARWLSFSPAGKSSSDRWPMTVVPRGFDQHASSVAVSRFRDLATAFAATGRMLCRHQAQIRHQLPRRLDCCSGQDLLHIWTAL